jgi:hypothetical protein
MRLRNTWVAVAIMSFAVGVSAPAASAATSKPEKRQNSAIKKSAKINKRQDKSIKKINAAAKQAGAALALLSGKTATAQKTADGANGKADAILAQAPAIFDALTKLKDGLTAAGAGLTALKDGLTQVGAGLTKLGSAFSAVEYGAVRLFVGGTDTGAIVQSADIPDDGNLASFSGTFPIFVPAGPGFAPGTPLQLRGAIRSNETDGTAGGTDPAGQVGGVLTVTCGSNGGCGGIDSGGVVCIAATAPSTFTLPDGSTTSARLVNVPERSGRTEQTQPTAAPSTKTVAVTGDCAVPTGVTIPQGSILLATASGSFADLPTSSSPGPTD